MTVSRVILSEAKNLAPNATAGRFFALLAQNDRGLGGSE